jgi:hypothetical protein
VSDRELLAPDAIEPLELWRTWNYEQGRLISHNRATWEPGQALEARCSAVDARAEEAEQAELARELVRRWPTASRERIQMSDDELGDELGALFADVFRHVTPEVDCTCGIYALDDPACCPPGVIYGKVALWGKVVRGETGARAQLGYPTALYVPDHLLGDEALHEYLVPLLPLETPGGPYAEGGAAAGTREPRRPIVPSHRATTIATLAA